MKEMQEVYLVVSGEYSDFGIDAIFDSEEAAKACIQDMGAIDEYDEQIYEYRIQTWTLNSLITADGKNWYHVAILLGSGNIMHVRREYRENQTSCQVFGEGGIGRGPLRLICTIRATDTEHAIKIANEKRIAYIYKQQVGQEAI